MLGRAKTTKVKRDRSESFAGSMTSGRGDGFETIGEDDRPTPRASHTAAPPVDDEGFSVPPDNRGRNPWEDPDDIIPTPAMAPMKPDQPKAASLTGSNRAEPPTGSGFAQTFNSSPSASNDNLAASITSSEAPKVNLAMTQAPIEENEEERQAALAKMQQSLSVSAPARRGTTRGRRDVRNTIIGGVGENGILGEERESSSPPVLSPPVVARQASLSSISNNPFDSPGLGSMASFAPALPSRTLAEEGLRASITETINVIMRAGEVQRLQITGEVHLSLKAVRLKTPIQIRLTSVESLDKIAPNPAFLTASSDQSGVYTISPEALTSSSAKGKTLIFKYQMQNLPTSSKLPLIMEPVFSCKENETRMILNHRSDVHDIALSATFAPGANVSNVQSKPVGTWSPSTRKMTWNVSGTGKIITKFTTEGLLQPHGVSASFTKEGTLSDLGIEIVGGDDWKIEEIQKGSGTGKYLAEPILQ